ncbi:MAG: TonB-dependent receptor [Deferribacteres bacterium]|nr:TonB-dependent receptor [candidate division KSB1 bacterium]MCB9500332.1 TonB-dependent receptor [Deferribacteres bacterium]
MKNIIITLAAMFTVVITSFAQTITQSVQGTVFDAVTKAPLPFANIVVLDTEPLMGTTSDLEGHFVLPKVPVGRHTIKIMMMGYESRLMSEILITTGKQISLNIGLEQTVIDMEEVVVRVSKDIPLNAMASVSSRQFTVEETQRYAGGFDDPARLASSFAGVSTPSVSSNGISVRGNNPEGILWRIEGVESPNPNHFADLTVVGGGLLTALSSQMMGNSDFYTGAFPAEFGNATSGVFDINLNTGNTEEREYTFQAGVIGIDFAAEGPFHRGGHASYLMNYRYSTMGLVAPILPEDTGILKYQDFAFKTNFPTRNAGIFTIWGISALDYQRMNPADSVDWRSDFDRDASQTSLYMVTTGLTHKISLNKNTFLRTTFAATGNGLTHKEKRLDSNLLFHPQTYVDNNERRYSVQSILNKRFSKTHSNQSGFSYSNLGYQLDIEQAEVDGNELNTLVKQSGNSGLIQLYTQSKFMMSPHLSLNIGVHSSYFLLNDNYSIEPRAGLKYDFNNKQNIAFAYGKHSRIERLPIYFVNDNGVRSNKTLDMLTSSHYVLAYNAKLNQNLRLCIEPYYQSLANIPVSPDTYISTINLQDDIFFNERLISAGTGRNIGVDVTLERFLHNGLYYLFTASLFDSKYKDAKGITRNSRFNKNYVLNLLAGKEWIVGKKKNNILSTSIRLNYLGGNRREAIDIDTSLLAKEVVYGEANQERAFSQRFDDIPVFSVAVSYRKNKPTYSSVWTLHILNATSTQEYANDFYNLKTGKVETSFEGIMVPNLSYKIEF